MKELIDASSAIHAWDNYPIEILGPLWNWLEKAQITTGLIGITRENFNEVEASPECHQWLRNTNIAILPINDAIIQEATSLKDALGIKNDKYGKGVDYNDILLIAAASVHHCNVITDEGIQSNIPKNKLKYKIPVVCRKIIKPSIKTFSFIDWLKSKNPNLQQYGIQ